MTVTKVKYRRTRHEAPLGYVAIDKPSAKLAFDAGLDVTIAGNNVNSYHIFNGWYLGHTINKARHEGEHGNNFEDIVSNFMYYLDSELGRYPVFYIKKGEL